MRIGDFIERRRFKRLDLSLPVKVNQLLSPEKRQEEQDGVTANVSFNGAYVIDIDIKKIKHNDKLKITISVPRDDTRDFPFSCLVGKATVTRVEEDGIALEFDEAMHRLFVAS